MAHVDPGELKYVVTVELPALVLDAGGHYSGSTETFPIRAGILSGRGADKAADGAARSEDSVTFILRWATRQRLRRDGFLVFDGVHYAIDWMDPAPWAGGYARVKGVSVDGER